MTLVGGLLYVFKSSRKLSIRIVFLKLRNPCLCARYPCWFKPPDALKITLGIRRMEDKSSNICSRAVCKLVVLVEFLPPMIDLSTEEVIDCW